MTNRYDNVIQALGLIPQLGVFKSFQSSVLLNDEEKQTNVNISIAAFIEEARAVLPHILTVSTVADAVLLKEPVVCLEPEHAAKIASDVVIEVLRTGGPILLRRKFVLEKVLLGYEESLSTLRNAHMIDEKLHSNNEELSLVLRKLSGECDRVKKAMEELPRTQQRLPEYETAKMLHEDCVSLDRQASDLAQEMEELSDEVRKQIKSFASIDWQTFAVPYGSKTPKAYLELMRAVMVAIKFTPPKVLKGDKSAAAKGKMDDSMVARCASSLLIKHSDFAMQLCGVIPGEISPVHAKALRTLNMLLNPDHFAELDAGTNLPVTRMKWVQNGGLVINEAANPVFEAIRRYLVLLDIGASIAGEVATIRSVLPSMTEELETLQQQNRAAQEAKEIALKGELDTLMQQIHEVDQTLLKNRQMIAAIERNNQRAAQLIEGISESRAFVQEELKQLKRVLKYLVSDSCVAAAVLVRAAWLPEQLRQESMSQMRQALAAHKVRVSDSPFILGHIADRLQLRQWSVLGEHGLPRDPASLNAMSLLYLVPHFSLVVDPDGSAAEVLNSVPLEGFDKYSVTAQRFSLPLLDSWVQSTMEHNPTATASMTVVVTDLQAGVSDDLICLLSADFLGEHGDHAYGNPAAVARGGATTAATGSARNSAGGTHRASRGTSKGRSNEVDSDDSDGAAGGDDDDGEDRDREADRAAAKRTAAAARAELEADLCGAGVTLVVNPDMEHHKTVSYVFSGLPEGVGGGDAGPEDMENTHAQQQQLTPRQQNAPPQFHHQQQQQHRPKGKHKIKYIGILRGGGFGERKHIRIPCRFRLVLISTKLPAMDAVGLCHPLPTSALKHVTPVYWSTSATASPHYVESKPLQAAAEKLFVSDQMLQQRMGAELCKRLAPAHFQYNAAVNHVLNENTTKLYEIEDAIIAKVYRWMNLERQSDSTQGLQISGIVSQNAISLSILNDDGIMSAITEAAPLRKDLVVDIQRSKTLLRELSAYASAVSETFGMTVDYVRMCGNFIPPEALSPHALSSKAIVTNHVLPAVALADRRHFLRGVPSSLPEMLHVRAALARLQRRVRERFRGRRLRTTSMRDKEEVEGVDRDNSNTAGPVPGSGHGYVSDAATVDGSSSTLPSAVDSNHAHMATLASMGVRRPTSISVARSDVSLDRFGLLAFSRQQALGDLRMMLAPLRTFFLREFVHYLQLTIRPGMEWLAKLMLLFTTWVQGPTGTTSLPVEEVRALMHFVMQSVGQPAPRYAQYMSFSDAGSDEYQYTGELSRFAMTSRSSAAGGTGGSSRFSANNRSGSRTSSGIERRSLPGADMGRLSGEALTAQRIKDTSRAVATAAAASTASDASDASSTVHRSEGDGDPAEENGSALDPSSGAVEEEDADVDADADDESYDAFLEQLPVMGTMGARVTAFRVNEDRFRPDAPKRFSQRVSMLSDFGRLYSAGGNAGGGGGGGSRFKGGADGAGGGGGGDKDPSSIATSRASGWMERGMDLMDGLWLNRRSPKWRVNPPDELVYPADDVGCSLLRGRQIFLDEGTPSFVPRNRMFPPAPRSGDTFEVEWLKVQGVRLFGASGESAALALGGVEALTTEQRAAKMRMSVVKVGAVNAFAAAGKQQRESRVSKLPFSSSHATTAPVADAGAAVHTRASTSSPSSMLASGTGTSSTSSIGPTSRRQSRRMSRRNSSLRSGGMGVDMGRDRSASIFGVKSALTSKHSRLSFVSADAYAQSQSDFRNSQNDAAAGIFFRFECRISRSDQICPCRSGRCQYWPHSPDE